MKARMAVVKMAGAASGMMTEERIHQVVRAGASAHMAKPFTSETLLQTVHRVLNSN